MKYGLTCFRLTIEGRNSSSELEENKLVTVTDFFFLLTDTSDSFTACTFLLPHFQNFSPVLTDQSNIERIR